MPQSNVPKHLRKKKKGHAPAHQNTFAFQHNPNSTKTSKIMDLPNVHVCRRCHDKIEWRKKYRKYKSRTQPGKCNICQQKRVMAAYHTICGKCSETDKAKKLVKEHLLTNPPKQHQSTNTDHHQDNDDPDREEEENGKNMERIGEEAKEQLEVNAEPANATEEEPEASTASTRKEGRRACCVCVKEFALPDPADEPKEEDPLTSGKKLTLRQRKTLERQKEAAKKKQTTSKKKQDDNTDPANDNQRQDNPFVDSDSDGDFDPLVDSDEDEDDPFLKAVGGKLLTGEAYQKALMEKEQRQA
ncbi:Uncharacterized conserved protein (DUF2039) [Seminavis robusta]|uniref:Uncharacterized conserved protein (DUF2039) n=1 Tax=Seminavis robusta TaxID=568900 RepID=A0A9N8EXV4_9STRA|nr:Uncharacterized conserved protein (DUF2039) [Seminavis robusta]|eukprot:Sro2207_g319080.1 Uncharacterized conserved protein (DUF2039) (300) ;mRNA; f:7569-8468